MCNSLDILFLITVNSITVTFFYFSDVLCFSYFYICSHVLGLYFLVLLKITYQNKMKKPVYFDET